MSLSQQAVAELRFAHERFNRSTQCLPETLWDFAPMPGMMTTSQQVAHCGRVIDWFMEGAFRQEGFDMNFQFPGSGVGRRQNSVSNEKRRPGMRR